MNNESEELQKVYRKWVISTLSLMVLIFFLISSVIIYIDPCFHYHLPVDNFEYFLDSKMERYINDGITQHFEYNGIITGTSMAANFKASEADEIFNTKFIKVPYSGGRYKEINDNLKRAYEAKKNIRYIIRALDIEYMTNSKNSYDSARTYPLYMYNDNIFDDVNYILNKSILIENVWGGVIRYTIEGNKTTDFDTYANWNNNFKFGATNVLAKYNWSYEVREPLIFTDEIKIIMLENIKYNVTDLADDHLETTFYYFFTPYSICYWDRMKSAGRIDWQIDAQMVAIEEILKHSNIKLYAFNNNFELVCNLDNYIDTTHYGEWVNSWMLEKMYNEEYLLTADNYREYIDAIREFYNSYDYEALHKLEN